MADSRPFKSYEDIDRPDYCECEPPWSTRTGPLKDGSHYHDCVAAQVAEDMAVLVRDRDRWRQRAETAETELNAARARLNLLDEVKRSLRRALTLLEVHTDT